MSDIQADVIMKGDCIKALPRIHPTNAERSCVPWRGSETARCRI
jgi:hypothetical protein